MSDPNNNGQSMPQGSQPFTFVPMPAPERREPQRNYVFVDEKNRHRRLKVMRACEGCRKRKIKCDAANTNTWPCSACVKQRLTCVPPSLSFDGDDSYETGGESSQFSTFSSAQSSDSSSIHQPSPGSVPPQLSYPGTDHSDQRHGLIDGSSHSFFSQDQAYNQYDFDTSDIVYPSIEQPYIGADTDQLSSSIHQSRSSDIDWRSETSDFELTEALGDLKISDVAIASYMVNQRGLAEAPAVQEEEIQLPQQSKYDNIVRIPPQMMPSDQVALDYFRYFFENIHPYVPVLYPPYFYKQWQRSKNSISPLILEGIFSCCTSMMEQKADSSSQWLALATKHEEAFRDVPRLSTLQALLLLMKAREAMPKRGYFYRSWMMVVNMVAMAKDLELHTHNELHDLGKPCDLPNIECIVKTRVWNVLYVVELMIGGPQGRFDLSVSSDTVDFDGSALPLDTDHDEVEVSLQFTQLMRVVRNVRETARIYVNLRRKKTDWALDPDFIRHDVVFTSWTDNLPQNLRVSFPNDGSPPWVPSHFVANTHSYHRLGIIMHHRPQLQQSNLESFGTSWKNQMLICYQAAKELCRLQEAILQQFGLPGLLSMQRGVSFTIYSILTCTMLHLVAVTSPDPDVNDRASEYFVRHMRLLEQASPSFPMKEMQDQIDSLRQAFSADVSKPFELRPNFPGSPPPRSDSSQNYLPTPSEELPLSYASGTATVTSAGLADQGLKPTSSNLLNPLANQYGGEQTYWNPSRIINQWDTAFGTMPQRGTPSSVAQLTPRVSPPTQIGDQQPSPYSSQMPSSAGQYMTYNQTDPVSTYAGHMPQATSSPPQQLPALNWTPPVQSFITPSMWQQAVASTYGEGQKRRWNDTPTSMPDRDAKRMR